KRARLTVEPGFPELHDLVFGVLLQGIVEVLERGGDVFPPERELSFQDVAGGCFIPALANPGDGLLRRVEVVLLDVDLGDRTRGEELSHRSESASKSSRASLGRLSDSV